MRLLEVAQVGQVVQQQTLLVDAPEPACRRTSHVAVSTITEPDGDERQIVRANMLFGSVGTGEFGT